MICCQTEEHCHRKREGGPDLPTWKALCDLDDTSPDTKIRDGEHYLDFCRMYANCVVARSTWRENCYSQKFCDYVTVSDEAFMLWTYINYSEWWLKKHRHEKHMSKLRHEKEEENKRKGVTSDRKTIMKSRRHFLFSSNMEDCSDMADTSKVGTPDWTSGGKTINNQGSTTRGGGVQLKGIQMFNEIFRRIDVERAQSEEFDVLFYQSIHGDKPKGPSRKKASTNVNQTALDAEHDFMEEYIRANYGSKSIVLGTEDSATVVGGGLMGEVLHSAEL